MMRTMSCQFCERSLTKSAPYCPSCGAPISGAKAAAATALPDTIRQIFGPLEEIECCYLNEAIPPKKRANATRAFGIPDQEQIIFLCDSTVFGSSRVGFALCESGLYWNNDWTLPTKRTYLSWTDFSQRTLKLNDSDLSLGRGDFIDLTNVDDEEKETLVLTAMQKLQTQFQTA